MEELKAKHPSVTHSKDYCKLAFEQWKQDPSVKAESMFDGGDYHLNLSNLEQGKEYLFCGMAHMATLTKEERKFAIPLPSFKDVSKIPFAISQEIHFRIKRDGKSFRLLWDVSPNVKSEGHRMEVLRGKETLVQSGVELQQGDIVRAGIGLQIPNPA